MAPAEGQAHGVLLGQRAVSGIAVDLQDADEAGEMTDRLFGLAVRRIEVGDAGRVSSAPGAIIAGIGEELARLRAAPAGIEHRRRGLVGEELPR